MSSKTSPQNPAPARRLNLKAAAALALGLGLITGCSTTGPSNPTVARTYPSQWEWAQGQPLEFTYPSQWEWENNP